MKPLHILLAAALLTSCSSVEKLKTRGKETVRIERDSVVSETVVTEVVFDTLVTIVQVTDTVTVIVPDTVETTVIDTPEKKVSVKVNYKTKEVFVRATTKQRELPIKAYKKVVENRTIKQSESIDKKVVSASNAVEKKSGGKWLWWIVLVIIFVGIVWFVVVKRWKIVVVRKPPDS